MAERVISAEELKKHNKQGDLWLAIHGNVYDVSDFMDDHPGGGDVLVDAAGINATDEFEDIGHSEAAREQMKSMLVGKVDGSIGGSQAASGGDDDSARRSGGGGGGAGMFVPVIVILLAIGFFLFKDQLLGGEATA